MVNIKEDKSITPEDANRLGLLHYKSGNRINFPQLEECNVYGGEKYCIKMFPMGEADPHHGAYVCVRKGPTDIICWTPHKDVADEIVANFKKCGWKYKDGAVEVLTSVLVKELNSNPKARPVKINTYAGFNAHTVTRSDVEIVVITQSPEVEEFNKK
jgi:hypothetical protein